MRVIGAKEVYVRVVALILTPCVASLACGGEDPNGPVQAVASVVVTPSGISLSGIGATHTFTAEAQDANGNQIAPTSVTWTSLNPTVAIIDHGGMATAVESGQVTILADIDGVVGYGLLTVSVPGVPPVTSWIESGYYGDLDRYLVDVWGSSSTDVYKVGSRYVTGSPVGNKGWVNHYDGTGWRTTYPVLNPLQAVWGTSASDVLALGSGTPSTPYHYDGSSWSAIGGFPDTLTAPEGPTGKLLWGTSPSDVYALARYHDGVNKNGTILHYNGAEWSEMVRRTESRLLGVWGTSSTDVFAVGYFEAADQTLGPTILHYDTNGWSKIGSGTGSGLVALWGTSSTDVYAVGFDGTILHYDGTSWESMTSGTTHLLDAVWGTSSTDVYAVGEGGTILHYDGTSWETMASETNQSLKAVWGTSTDVYVVGLSGTGVTITLTGTR